MFQLKIQNRAISKTEIILRLKIKRFYLSMLFKLRTSISTIYKLMQMFQKHTKQNYRKIFKKGKTKTNLVNSEK